MKLKNLKITSKGLYWGLIITFAILYLCVGFVSTLHSITFFQLANNLGLAILLGLTYELGQAGVLFGILMTKNKDKFLPWALMILLTALQVTANVYASFKFMSGSGSQDYLYWQKAILFGVQASPEMYQVIISWISGALLPIVALGMTALVAENIKMATEEDEVNSLSPQMEEELGERVHDMATTQQEEEKLGKQFEKEFIIPDPPKERPPKRDKKVSVPKKAQKPLPKDEVKIPEKKRRVSNPLKKKNKKPQVIKHIEQINAPSKGEELIQRLEDEVKPIEDSAPIEAPVVVETPLPEPVPVQPIVVAYNDGIEVVDVKAVPVKKN